MSNDKCQINWFSPLPPARTGIADYTFGILPELSRRAEVTLWTDRTGWDPALEQYAALLDELRAAGFDEPAAVRLVRAVSSIVFGDAFAALTVEPMLGPGADSRRPSEEDVWILISQALPADTPPELVRVAHAICAADYGPTFDEALDLLLEGAMERRHAS